MKRPYRALALIPMLAVLSAPWVANRVEPRVLGLPFLLAFIVGAVLLSSLVMGIIFVLDQRHDRQES